MKTKTVGMMVASVLSLGVVAGVPTFAEEVSQDQNVSQEETFKGGLDDFHGKGLKHGFKHPHYFMKGNMINALLNGIETYDLETEGITLKEVWKDYREARLLDEANKLGIDTEGKMKKEIAKEVRETKLLQEAEKYGIHTDGKSVKEIRKEGREAKLYEKAEEYGIETEGKTLREIAIEVREAFIIEKAEQLGIDTEGKDSHELHRFIHEQQLMNKAEELGIDTEGKGIDEMKQEVIDAFKAALEELGIILPEGTDFKENVDEGQDLLKL